jgi:hypothetical protein
VTDVDRTNRDGSGRPHTTDAFTGWFRWGVLRFGRVLFGIFLQLAALGQLAELAFLGDTA